MRSWLRRHWYERRVLAGQFARFAVVGATNTTVDFGTYILITRGFGFWSDRLIWANVAAYCLAVTVSFILNNFWTFRREAHGWEGRSIKFLAVSLASLAWNSLAFGALTSIGVHDLFAKAGAVAIVGAWNFAMYRTWAFRG